MAASTLSQKLRIKEGYSLITKNAPPEYKKSLGPLPNGVKIQEKTANLPDNGRGTQIHWFVKDRKQMEKELKEVLSMLHDDIVCWIYYPKGTSKIQTDLTRDKGWDALLKHDELQWISLISFDETWSSFGMRLKTEADRKKESKPKERPIFDWVDPKTKTVKLPEDFETALKKSKTIEAFFHALNFSNKKEYIEWIVTAKREETRKERVKESIARMKKGWKNPANR